MSKDAYYFPHDSNARHDPKIVAMMSVYGFAGYGKYWVIVEMLREQKDYKYSLSAKYSYHALSKELGLKVEEAEKFIDDCVNQFDLFSINEDGWLFSESLNQRMIKLDARKDRAKAASDIRWNKGQNTHKITSEKEHPNNTEIKKSRLVFINPEEDGLPFAEEKPVKNGIKVLTDLKEFNLFVTELLSNKTFAHLPIAMIEMEKDKCLDWMKQKGARKKDYKAFFRNWLRTAMKDMPDTGKKKGMVF